MSKPLRKTASKPARKPVAQKTDAGLNKINDRLPTQGGTIPKHDHRDGRGCFAVKLGGQTFHWPDEGGAVMFGMRHSRERGEKAVVHDPNGKVICTFDKREYDWRAHVHRYTQQNEELQAKIFSAKYLNRQDATPRKPDRVTASKNESVTAKSGKRMRKG